MGQKLTRQFFLRPTLTVARQLLGKYLVHRSGKKKIIGQVVETEAYVGPQDLASHAKGGQITSRNLAEYMIGGHIYIYLVYGIYWQLNISTGRSGVPECVLIRAVEPILPKFQISNLKFKINLTNGPGKLCQYLKIDGQHYGLDLVTSREIWLEDGQSVSPRQIVADRRIGIDYAGPIWSNKKWRFYIKNNPYVSKFKR